MPPEPIWSVVNAWATDFLAKGGSTGRRGSPCKVNEPKMSVNGTFTWTEEPFVVSATAPLALKKTYKVSSAA